MNGALNVSALGAYNAAGALAGKAAAADPDASRASCGQGHFGDAIALTLGRDGSFAACRAGLCVTTL